jgi:hypothetical protein
LQYCIFYYKINNNVNIPNINIESDPDMKKLLIIITLSLVVVNATQTVPNITRRTLSTDEQLLTTEHDDGSRRMYQLDPRTDHYVLISVSAPEEKEKEEKSRLAETNVYSLPEGYSIPTGQPAREGVATPVGSRPTPRSDIGRNVGPESRYRSALRR